MLNLLSVMDILKFELPTNSYIYYKFFFQILFRYTVKPVYNGHPWDLKNMVVM